MQYIVRKTGKTADIRIDLPASKSITNRLLVISALSGSKMDLGRALQCDDILIMDQLLRSAGEEKNAGHAGTVMRFLTAYYSLVPGKIILTGSERMKERPIGELVNKLRELGARIEYSGKEGYPPLRIEGGHMIGGNIQVDAGISSQFISALLLIAPYLPGGLNLTLKGKPISSSYIRLTTGLMTSAGVHAEWKDNTIHVKEGTYRQGTYTSEPDWSAASYWFAVVSITKKMRVLFPGLKENSLQGDSKLPSIFRAFDVESVFTPEGLQINCCAGKTAWFRFDFKENPDLVQTVVPVCIAHSIPFEIKGTGTLRIKETDRIEAMAREMRKFKVELTYDDKGDWIRWDGHSGPV